MTGQKIAYRRVSTTDQSTARQLDGMTFDREFEDKVSGKSQDRPALKAMLAHVRQGDEVVIHSMDRLARNLQDLLHLVKEMTGRGALVTFKKENMTFTGEDSPMANMMLGIIGSVAAFERSMILERQREGIALAKVAGKYRGRKPSLSTEQKTEIRTRAAAGERKAVLALEYKVSRETVYQCLRATE